ncbi:MAG: patatin-like phospholipase family protein [Pseudohongiellaceae bacterium]
MSSDPEESPRFGLVLSGGGARAAYQVGVMRGISMVLPKDAPNPFHIIAGTSAGALNAASLATHAHRLRTGIRTLEYIWKNIDSSQVYRVDARGLLGSAANWAFSFLGNRRSSNPVSLLDNSPLEELLNNVLRMERLQEHMAAGHLETISITASAYYSGNSVSFFQSRHEIEDWYRPHRVGFNTDLSVRHLLASTAIPTLFPAVKIGREYYGDGAIRQLAPLSPAIRLGADRILAIGVSGANTEWVEDESPLYHPSLGQIIGHVLNSAFVDTLESDMAVLRRYNRLLASCQAGPDPALRPIELLEITPSIDLNAIASKHAGDLPRSIRLFIRDTSASSLVSLLLFEQAYCQELMNLGLKDALAKREQIRTFFRVRTPANRPVTPQPA